MLATSAVRGWIRALGCAAAVFCATADAADAGNGLTLPGVHARDGGGYTSSLRGRFTFGLGAPAGSGVADDAFAAPPSLVSARLLGDYYFGRPATGIGGRASGFRATSGVLLGSRLGAWVGASGGAVGPASVNVERRSLGLSTATPGLAGRDEGGTVPYVGIGYSDAFDKGRWGISADLGLMALRRSGGARLGATTGGVLGADEQLRDLRLAPMLQLGVSYSF